MYDNPMIASWHPMDDWKMVPVEDYETKRFPCSRCGESTADFDLDEDGVCETCREEKEKGI
jgi:formylmethanofuran dehydrogenase subunit E